MMSWSKNYNMSARGDESGGGFDLPGSPGHKGEGIAGTPTSLGWVGYAFARENDSRVKLLEVDDGESGCVAPTPETIASNEYPISRDLFIYVNEARLDANPAVGAFVDFYLSDEGIANAVRLAAAVRNVM